MIRRYHYIAETESGTSTEIQVEGNEPTIAHAEAKMEVERWLADEGETPDRLTKFDFVFREPA